MVEDFIPTKDIDEEKNEQLPWDREEVLVDENLHVAVDVKDLVMTGKEWGKAFDPIPCPFVDESDESDECDVVEAPLEPGEVDKLQVGLQFKTIAHFKVALTHALIKSHYEVLTMEAKKTIYSAKYHKKGYLWKVCVGLKSGRLNVTRYCGDHICGTLTLGRDHMMVTTK